MLQSIVLLILFQGLLFFKILFLLLDAGDIMIMIEQHPSPQRAHLPHIGSRF